MTFRVDVNRLLYELLEIGTRLRENERSRRVQAAIEINGANERLKGVGQCRGSLPAATGLLHVLSKGNVPSPERRRASSMFRGKRAASAISSVGLLLRR